MPHARICTLSGALYTGNRCGCPAHAAKRRTDNTRRLHKRQAHGRNTAAWQRIRIAVLRRANHRCQLHLAGCTSKATTVHRLPQYGTRHDNNLNAYRAACTHCHGRIDAPRATR